MNAEEIRSTFSHNAVYSLNKDEGMLISLQIIAIGELAAQLAENNVLLKVAHSIPDDPACRERKCDYYTHYLAYGPADLTHDGYHAAVTLAEEHHKNCHICQPGSTSTKVCNSAAKWEERIRA